MGQGELTDFFAELTEFAAELSESKQCSARFLVALGNPQAAGDSKTQISDSKVTFGVLVKAAQQSLKSHDKGRKSLLSYFFWE